MDIRTTALPEVKVPTPRRFGDPRGYFCETWSAARMAGAEAARELPILHVSTDHVFDRAAGRPWRVDDPTAHGRNFVRTIGALAEAAA